MIYVAALVLGIVSGLRTLTSVAVLLLSRGGVWGIVAAVAAVGEYIADLMPWIPARTKLPSIVLRPASGAFVGYLFCTMHGASGIIGAVGGVIGALAGTYGGYAARIALSEKIGALASALAEDVIAILIALLVVTR